MRRRDFLVGVDEVGRGPLAGPLTVCAVIIPKSFSMRRLAGVDDSKKMKKNAREEWSARAWEWKKNGEIDFRIASVGAGRLDKMGLSKAIRYLLNKVLKGLDESVTEVRLDGGLYAPARFTKQKTIIKGDSKEKVIGLASVIAKVYRDKKMVKVGELYPDYGFHRHVGYGTKAHFEAIQKYGVTKEHRKCFLKNII